MKYDWRTTLFILLATATVFVRPFYQTRGLETFSFAGTYEAISHMVAGGLFFAWLETWKRLYLLLFVGVNAVEILAFLFWR